jgi:hypothetical protein
MQKKFNRLRRKEGKIKKCKGQKDKRAKGKEVLTQEQQPTENQY